MSHVNGVRRAVFSGLQVPRGLHQSTFRPGHVFAGSIVGYSDNNSAEQTITRGHARRWKLGSWFLPMLLLAAFASVARANSVHGHSNGVLSNLSCSAASIPSAGKDGCTVTLSGPAPKGGLSVALSSSNALVSVPAAVTVPMNASSVTFTATAGSTQTSQSVNLVAAANGISKSLTLQVSPSTSTLSLSSSSIAFGDVPTNTTAKYSVTLTSSGTSPVTIDSATVAGTGFGISGAVLPLILSPGQSVAMAVQFSPAVTGAVSGQLVISSTSSTYPTAVIALSGNGTSLPLTVSALSCSNASVVGTTTDACTVALNAAAPSSGLSVSVSSSNPAVTVPTTVLVPANATTAGFVANIGSVTSDQTATVAASLGGASASFVLQLKLASASLSTDKTQVTFANTLINTPVTQSLILTSTGTTAVTINGAALSGTGFTMSGATFPLTLNPNQSVPLTLQFDPTVAGAASGQLTITSNSSTNPTVVIGLSGSGISHQVNLAWNAPISSTDVIAGYNIYRTLSGGTTYQLINSSPVSAMNYTDGSVQSGSNYGYIVTSVDSSGVESNPSDTIGVAIP